MRHDGWTWIERTRRGVCYVVTLFTATLAIGDETRLIPLQHRQAAELMPLIRPLLGPNDAVSGTDYRLIVRSSAPTFREIEKLLAQVDIARRQLRIGVKQTVTGDSSTADLGVAGMIQSDGVRIEIARQPRFDNRGAIAQKDGLRLETRRSQTTASGSSTQFISTLDGAPAFVRVGQSFAHVQRILALTGTQQLVLAQGVSLHSVITGFDVTPQVQGENVSLQITPRLSRLENPTTLLVNFQEYSTTVVVRPGEWIDVGGIAGTGADVRRLILDSASTQTGERRTVFVKVE